MSNQIKVLVGSLVAGVAALTLVTGSASAAESGCGCCKKMAPMPAPMPMPNSMTK